jgi:putative DNA primase/helicase
LLTIRLEEPTHDELAERVLEQLPGLSYDGEDYRVYRPESGLHERCDKEVVQRAAYDVLVAAKERGIRPTITTLNSVLSLTGIQAFVPRSRFDKRTDILVCQNGTLHLPEGILRPHSPEHFATAGVPFEFSASAEATAFLNVLRRLEEHRPGVSAFLQEYAGYCLTHDTQYETAVWLCGPRGSGKSTVIHAFQVLTGPLHGRLDLKDVGDGRFGLANVPGKTLLTATEQPSGFVKSTDKLKAIISGEPVTIEDKYRRAFVATPTAKILWGMEEPPRVTSAVDGLFRRIKVIQFPELPESDRNPFLREAIEHEGPGLLAWAIDGLRRLESRRHTPIKGFQIPDCVRTATAEFERENDVPRLFVDDVCTLGPLHTVSSNALYNAYRFWCDTNGHKPKTSTAIAKDWKRLGFTNFKAAGKAKWRGVKLTGEYATLYRE